VLLISIEGERMHARMAQAQVSLENLNPEISAPNKPMP